MLKPVHDKQVSDLRKDWTGDPEYQQTLKAMRANATHRIALSNDWEMVVTTDDQRVTLAQFSYIRGGRLHMVVPHNEATMQARIALRKQDELPHDREDFILTLLQCSSPTPWRAQPHAELE